MPTFPALDEEPPPLTPWQVLARVAAVVAVLAVATTLLLVRPWRWAGAADPPRAEAPPSAKHPNLLGAGGRVLVLDFHTGRFGYTAPDGTGFKPLRGASVSGVLAQVSPDGTAVATDGQVVRFHGDGAVPSQAVPPGDQNSLTTTSYPWADHGRRLLLMTVGGGHAAVSTVDLRGRDEHSLGGGAADAVGDPTRDGALVMVAGRSSVNMGMYTELPTVRLELRTPGHAHVLATTIGLATEGGLPGRHSGKLRPLPYRVTATFSPNGQQIAVSLDQLSRAPSAAHGLVVISRSGKPLFRRSSSTPVWATWSHTGDQLAFQAQGSDHVSVLNVDDPRATPQDIPIGRADLGACLWSPEDAYLLCDDYRAGRRYVLQLSSRRTVGPVPIHPKERFALDWQENAA